MQTSLTSEQTAGIFDRLDAANQAFRAVYPGDTAQRQPVHTVYGGAHLFKADAAPKMGRIALRHLAAYAPTAVALAEAMGLGDDEDTGLADIVYRRVVEKLEREPVEDYRIDFEDGFGNRPDAEEDAEAVRTAEEAARGMAEGTLPPFIGIRIKPLTEDLTLRAVRTLDLFVSTLAARTGGRLPDGFIVTLPKVTIPDQVAALVALFDVLEDRTDLPPGALRLEIMVETPQSILDRRGAAALPAIVAAAQGRCRGAHFGVYDYTASCGITAAYQTMTHPVCDFARHVMQVALAGAGLWLSDGATNVLPVGPHRAARGGPPLTEAQQQENQTVVHRAWKMAYDDVRHSLRHGYYQGWDLHPAQLIPRYAAVYAFFLEGLDAAALRLKTFVEQAAQATLIGDVMDDAATGQALLNYFLRAITCGAITLNEARVTGLTIEEIRSRSFYRILENRRKQRSTA